MVLKQHRGALAHRKALPVGERHVRQMRQAMGVNRGVLEIRVSVKMNLPPHHRRRDGRMRAIRVNHGKTRHIIEQPFRLGIRPLRDVPTRQIERPGIEHRFAIAPKDSHRPLMRTHRPSAQVRPKRQIMREVNGARARTRRAQRIETSPFAAENGVVRGPRADEFRDRGAVEVERRRHDDDPSNLSGISFHQRRQRMRAMAERPASKHQQDIGVDPRRSFRFVKFHPSQSQRSQQGPASQMNHAITPVAAVEEDDDPLTGQRAKRVQQRLFMPARQSDGRSDRCVCHGVNRVSGGRRGAMHRKVEFPDHRRTHG